MTNTSREPEQAGVIAFRRRDERLEFCLVRKVDGGWGIPKGIIEYGDTQRMTALREAWEEAGITGRLLGNPLGTYEYEKWGGRLRVAVYLMAVRASRARWPEADLRRRHWVSYARANVLLRRHPAHPLLAPAFVRLSAPT